MNWTPEMYQAFLLRDLARKEARKPGRPRGPSPLAPVRPASWTREADLHEAILEDCRKRGWASLHGSMAHRTRRTIGEPDFVILAEGGRVLLVEAKVGKGKLSEGQQWFRAQAHKLGHTVYLVRNLSDWLEVARDVEVLSQ